MKKKTTFLKTLLVAAGLLMGGVSAWGQTTTTLLEYGTNDVAWTTDRLAEWTAGGSPTLADGVVTISGGNGSYETSKAITYTENSIINVTAVWRGRSNTGRAFSAGNGSYFRFGNIVVAQNDQDKKHGYGFSGIDAMASVTTFAAGSYRVDVTSSTWLKIEAEINTASNTLTSFTIKSEDGATTYVSQTNVNLASADYTTVAFGYRKEGGVSTTNTEQLKSVKITQTTQEVVVEGYTIKYQDMDGNELKADDTSRTGVVGDAIVVTAADKADFYTGTAGDKSSYKKWTYNSDNSASITINEAGTATVIVKFSEVAKYDYSIDSKAGETVLPYTYSGWQFNGETVKVPFPRYQLVGGTLYEKGANSSEYNHSFTLSSNNQEVTLDYADSGISGVVYCTEGENIEGATKATPGAASTRASQSAVGTSTGALTLFENLPVGKYVIVTGLYKNSQNNNQTSTFTIGTNTIVNATTGTGVNLNVVSSDEFTQKSVADVVWAGNGQLDYVYIQKTGDVELPASVPVTVTSAGYATYCSEYDLDLSGVTAYTATVADKTVTFTQNTGKVAAGTGLLIKAAAGTVNIPVVSDGGASAVADNALIGVLADTEVAAGSFVLMKATEGVGFYKTNNAFTVGANTAYIAALPDAAKSFIGFDDVTGIESLKAEKVANGQWFNLAGQRVAQPTKGLYIQNGKKVIVK